VTRGVLGRRFDVALATRIAALIVAAAAFAWAVSRPGLYATTLLAALATAAALAELWAFTWRTNIAVSRFIEAVTHGDFTQAFDGGYGGGFAALGASLNAAIAQLRGERAETEAANRMLSALIDDVPSPLLGIDGAGVVSLLNKAARRLLAHAGGVRIADLAAFGPTFAADIATICAGDRRSTLLHLGGAPTAAVLTCAELVQPSGTTRVIAVQPIQAELDRAELAAQTDLVRVLTHEIMNSMTPVTSLSATAAALIAAADTGNDPAIGDARAAIETVARRAEGVMHFVRTYRQLTRPPELRRSTVALAPLFAELARLIATDWPPAQLALTVEVVPEGLAIDADPDLLAQLLINLLRNAAAAATDHAAAAATDHAAGHAAAPAVALVARARKGGGVAIDVIDNGPGVPDDLRQDIFLPFFTTKTDGTGVGLSLARQIALAHGGALTCEALEGGGTRFRLVL
jgi:two-component system, NtrC family, nitrogen regulation sensor histidine kinase NtrY